MKRKVGLVPESSCATITTVFCMLVATPLVHTTTTTTSYSPVPASPGCCALGLLDATRQVAIETDRVLPSGTFLALKLRLCTADPVAVQIWTRVNATACVFKWQTTFIPTVDQIYQPFTMIDIANNPVTIGPADRLGIYNPSNLSSKIPVPYDTNPQASQYYSLFRYTGSQFMAGQLITLDDLKWPRTFSAYITLCPSTTICPTIASQVPPAGVGPAPMFGQCCASSLVQNCDAGGAIQGTINSQANQVQQLQDKTRQLQVIVTNLLNSDVITGVCPVGFISGVYGIGKCYIVHREERLQMAQAVIKCRDLYSAGLLKIQSALEDSFIKSFLLNITNPAPTEQYWTAGMYYIPLRNWYWYDLNLRIKAPFTYRNWRNGMEPAPTTLVDICSVYTVDYQQVVDYWEKNTCTLLNYYICEVPKKCL